MTDINTYRIQKATKEISRNTKEGGYILAEACYKLAYYVREKDSQMKANIRNLDRIN